MNIADFKGTVAGGSSGGGAVLAWNSVAAETDLSVGVGSTVVCGAPAAGKQRMVQMTNISTAGQNIRVGAAPSFAGPNLGTLLSPGQGVTWVIASGFPGVNAIADAASGTLNVEIMDT